MRENNPEAIKDKIVQSNDNYIITTVVGETYIFKVFYLELGELKSKFIEVDPPAPPPGKPSGTLPISPVLYEIQTNENGDVVLQGDPPETVRLGDPYFSIEALIGQRYKYNFSLGQLFFPIQLKRTIDFREKYIF